MMQMVEQHCEGMFPGKVARCRMPVDMRIIDSLVKEYWATRQKTIDLLDEYEAARKRGRPVKRRTVRFGLDHPVSSCP